ncbi:MAG TPA: 2-methylcitrate synthase, partial [Idiomarina baltica]|nr:2-methylcitrate synthase [Idiomarina baltica]
MAEKKLGGAGLRGQSAGETALCTVGKSGSGLTYRGYDIKELAEKVSFEEVAYLLAKGELPNQAELDAYRKRLKSMRILPQEVKDVLERIPKEAHPMDVLRTGCSMLGNLETEESFDEADDKIERMIATFPGMVLYWYRFTHDGVRIDTDSEEQSTGAHFLRLLHDESPSKLHADVMNTSLILYAEHEFNASTFTARVCASTLSDIHSCVTGAIGSLRGPLHGGANEAAMELIEDMKDPEDAEKTLMDMLERKEK